MVAFVYTCKVFSKNYSIKKDTCAVTSTVLLFKLFYTLHVLFRFLLPIFYLSFIYATYLIPFHPLLYHFTRLLHHRSFPSHPFPYYVPVLCLSVCLSVCQSDSPLSLSLSLSLSLFASFSNLIAILFLLFCYFLLDMNSSEIGVKKRK